MTHVESRKSEVIIKLVLNQQHLIYEHSNVSILSPTAATNDNDRRVQAIQKSSGQTLGRKSNHAGCVVTRQRIPDSRDSDSAPRSGDKESVRGLEQQQVIVQSQCPCNHSPPVLRT